MARAFEWHSKGQGFNSPYLHLKLFLVILLTLFITSCPKDIPNIPEEPDNPPSHTHTFSKEWTYDETYHYHKATCEHDVVKDKAEHTFTDNKCSVCSYEKKNTDPDPNPDPPIHTHTFETAWSYDATYHYHKATCGHDVVSAKTEHSFDEKTCIICNYKKENTTPTPEPKPEPTIGIQYKYNNMAYSVVGLGLVDNYDIAIPNTYNDGINGEYPVTLIENKAFYNTNITSVIIPESITEIGEYAFQYTPITKIQMGNGVTKIKSYAFSNCKSLNSIEWSDKLTTIGASAFEYCSSLKDVVIPDSVSEIGNYAFRNVKNIKSLKLSENLKILGRNAFGDLQNLETLVYNSIDLDTTTRFQYLPQLKVIKIGKNVKNIPANFFDSCASLEEVIYNATNTKTAILLFNASNLKTVTITDEVENIPPYIFSNATNLTSVTFGKNVKSVGMRAFDNCTSLAYLTLNDNLSYIDGYAFRGSGIQKVTIPEGITFIQGTAFSECNNLKTIYWNASVYNNEEKREFDGGIFEQCKNIETVIFGKKANLIPDGLFTDINSLTTVFLSDSIESIGYGAFAGCTSLTEITIPSGVKTIGEFAFRGDEFLNTVNFTEGLIEIKDYAFLECRDLRKAILPNTLQKMTNPFTECAYLTTVHLGKSLSEIVGDEVFADSTSLETITIDSRNEHYTVENNVLYDKNKTTLMFYPPRKTDSTFEVPNSIEIISTNAFRDTVYLREIKLSKTLKTIGSYAFMGSSLQNVDIPESITELIGTFADCFFLETVNIGKKVANIDIETFDSCQAITEFNVNADNQIYSSIDGNLYNKNGNNLLKYALGKENDEFVISSSITKITKNAFVGASTLSRIVFENTDNWYVSTTEDMSDAKLITGLDNSETMAEVLTDTDNYGSMYFEYRP